MLRILIIASLLCLFSNCKDTPSTNTNSTNTTASDVTANPGPAKTNSGVTIIPADQYSKFPGLWEVFVAFNSKTKLKDVAYDGRWYRFNRDNTFTSGVYDKELYKGQWTFNPATSLFHFIYEGKSPEPFDEWAIEGADGISDSFVLVGKTAKNDSRYHIRLTAAAELPRPKTN